MATDGTIFGRLADHMAALKKAASELEFNVFQTPPKDMAEFNYRRGRWEELQNELKALAAVVRGEEEDDQP